MRNATLFCLLMLSTLAYAQSQVKNHPISKTISNWEYFQDTDEMSSKIIYTARASSDKIVDDHGTSKHFAFLTIENDATGNSIIINIRQEEFMRHNTDSTFALEWKFDDNESERCAFLLSAAPKPDFIYLTANSSQKWIDKIKSSKRIKIYLIFSDARGTVVTFNVSGLKWDYPNKPR